MEKKEVSVRNYNLVAFNYELTTQLYSAGRIKASKLSQIGQLNEKDKVLYVGGGSADDAINAVSRNIDITCIDIAPAMIKKAKKKFENNGAPAELICGNVLDHDRYDYYDVVVANYFLNVFTIDEMKYMIDYLVRLIKPGGKILIADFAPPNGNIIIKTFHKVYYRIANVFYWLIGLAPLHKIYDYPSYFPNTLEYKDRKRFGFYESITAIRKS